MSPSLCVEKENLLHYINWKLVVLIDVVMGEVYNIPYKKIDALRRRNNNTTAKTTQKIQNVKTGN